MVYDSQYTQYQLKNRCLWRKLARDFYLNAALRLLSGPTIDFGCGVGELLRKLPKQSVGLDINPASVEYCLNLGLDTKLYDPKWDQYQLKNFLPGRYESLIISHVLEHLEHPENVLRALFNACRRLNIQRVVVIIPGKRGFSSDRTHQTYIDFSFFCENQLTRSGGYTIVRNRYFPVNIAFLGNVFRYHELHIVYERDQEVNNNKVRCLKERV